MKNKIAPFESRHRSSRWQVLCMAWLTAMLIGCEPSEPGDPMVFPLPALTSVVTGTTQYGSYSIKREYFVVANAPTDRQQIREFVAGYLDSRAEGTEDTSHTTVFQKFYRETSFTPRDYTEANKGYFDHDRIEDHARDLLVSVGTYLPTGKREFRFLSPELIP